MTRGLLVSSMTDKVTSEGSPHTATESIRRKARRRKKRSALTKRTHHILIAAVAYVAAGIFHILPLETASNLGGWFLRTFGRHHRRHKVARCNIELALPHLSPAEIDRVLTDMWDNLGRVLGEFAHLTAFRDAIGKGNDIIQFQGLEHLVRLKQDYRGAVFIGGHIANWELAPLILQHMGIETVTVYRPQNNPYVERLLFWQRSKIHSSLIAKRGISSPESRARDLARALHRKSSVTMSVDQKFRRGLSLPFFGHDAMTITAPARLALKYKVPIIPIRIERVTPVRFRISAYPPIDIPEEGDREERMRKITASINRVLEGWIRERPGQWHWIHTRWPKPLRSSGPAGDVFRSHRAP